MKYLESPKRLSEKTRPSKDLLFKKSRLDVRRLGGMEGSTDPCWIYGSKMAVSLRLNILSLALSFSSFSIPLFLPPLYFPLAILPIPLLFFSLSIFLFACSGLCLTLLGFQDSFPQNDSSFLAMPLSRCGMWVVSHCSTMNAFWSSNGLYTPWKLAASLQ